MQLAELIAERHGRFQPLFRPALTAANTLYIELSTNTGDFEGMSEGQMDAAIFERIDAAGAIAGVGGYLEKRSVYRDTALFKGDEDRCIHIGVDVFMPAGTPIYAPLDGVVHSFANRNVEGDYGPVIILGHELDGFEFHSLYGHLAENSLEDLEDGKTIAAGQKLAEIGARPGNGNWTPHLHFQLVRDMQNYRGDYPGVVREADLEYFKGNCPDPGTLLVSSR